MGSEEHAPTCVRVWVSECHFAKIHTIFHVHLLYFSVQLEFGDVCLFCLSWNTMSSAYVVDIYDDNVIISLFVSFVRVRRPRLLWLWLRSMMNTLRPMISSGKRTSARHAEDRNVCHHRPHSAGHLKNLVSTFSSHLFVTFTNAPFFRVLNGAKYRTTEKACCHFLASFMFQLVMRMLHAALRDHTQMLLARPAIENGVSWWIEVLSHVQFISIWLKKMVWFIIPTALKSLRQIRTYSIRN